MTPVSDLIRGDNMSQMNQKISYHIDELRRQSSMKIPDFCDDICSERQYSRYMNGSNLMPQDKLIAFCDKLGLSPHEFYHSYYSHDSEDYKLSSTLFYSLVRKDYKNVQEQIDLLFDHQFINNQAEELFNYCLIRYQHETRSITRYYALDKYSGIIDYPNCLEKKLFNMIDIVCLLSIAFIEYDTKKYNSLEFLTNLLLQGGLIYISSNTKDVLPSIYAAVSRLYGMLKDNEKELEISNKGIEYSLSINNNAALEQLYYYNSLAHYRLGSKDKAFDSARNCLITILSKKNYGYFEYMIDLMHKDFNIDPYTLLNIDKYTFKKTN